MVYKVISNFALVDVLSHIYKGDIINPLVNPIYKGNHVFPMYMVYMGEETCESPCKLFYMVINKSS